jgi:hypothetical protein
MSEPDAPGPAKFENVAHNVGIQGSVVHESNVYFVHPDAEPSQKYAVGVRYLDDGVPTDARSLISDAIAHGHETAEVRFHWMLAMLSKRSLRDLTSQEHDQLDRVSHHLEKYANDVWKHALATMFALLDQLRDGDCSSALQQVRELLPEQRDKILRHLDLVLTGGAKESLWAETREMAERQRTSGDRLGRVWAYFHPVPIGPRARPPVDDSTVPGDRLRAIAWSCLAVLAFGYIGWTAVRVTPVLVLGCAFVVVAVSIGARCAFEWRYRSERLAAKEREFAGGDGDSGDRTGEPGFASQISSAFEHYFSKYLPTGMERGRWRAITAGIRRSLRDEVVEIYRESRVEADRVSWLVRHLASDIRSRWEDGRLFDHRTVYRTPATTKVWCLISALVGGLALGWIFYVAVQADAWLTAIAGLVMAAAARTAARNWYWVVSEGRRAAEDREDYERRLEARRVAYERWKEKLDSTRPSEGEMERWLACDKTMLLDRALRHYGLAWRDVITHAFLPSPAKSYKRARVRRGPWRYSKYDVRLFLITRDGVREVSTELDFEHVLLGNQERTNFRFDAVSSVHVVESGTSSCTLELTLFNGPSRNIRVVDAELRDTESGVGEENSAQTSLDSAGFAHTLHILEGIAAEGKNWIKTAVGVAR